MKITKLLTIIILLTGILVTGCYQDDYEEIVGKCPSVLTDPADGAENVFLNKIIKATFNEEMDPSTITESSFIIMQGTTQISGTVVATDSIAIFTSSAAWLPYTTYTGTIKSTVKDLTGNVLQTNYVWTFTTIPQITLLSNPLLGGTTTGGGTFAQGSVVTVTATPNMGYAFLNWTENGIVVSSIIAAGTAQAENAKVVSTSSSYQFTVNGNKILSANFTVIIPGNFAISLSSNPLAGGTTNGSGSFAENSVNTVNASANTGYTFLNWTEGGLSVSTNASYQLTALTQDRTLVAIFLINNHTLTVNAVNGSVTKNPNQTTYDYGTIVQLTPTPAVGYSFSGWSGDASGSVTPLMVTMNSDKNITANFTQATYTLNITADNGSVAKNPNQTTYTNGTSVQLTPTANIGYTFASWSGDASGSANPLTVIMTANKDINANFAADPTYTLGVTAINGSVTKNPNLTNYVKNASVQLTAVPDLGYSFTSWSGDATGTVNPFTITMNSNKTVTAVFTLIPPLGPGVVDLGTAADFTALSKSGISNTGVTLITGDIGVSPSAATLITGFALIMDASNQFSKSIYVTGKVFASDYTLSPPAKMTTAISDMETAFTTANGLTTNTITELGAGNISGLTLAPGLYKWSTGVLITNAGVTLNGGPNDTWVFLIAQDLTVNSAAIVHLTGGAQAKNIFWTTAGSATLGTTSDFSGNILSHTLISLDAGAKVTGRLLAQTAVTLNAATVIVP